MVQKDPHGAISEADDTFILEGNVIASQQAQAYIDAQKAATEAILQPPASGEVPAATSPTVSTTTERIEQTLLRHNKQKEAEATAKPA